MGYRYAVLVAVAAAGLLVAGSAFATKSDHWVVMDLGTRGSTTASFERLGQPITPGQVTCMTNNYRARIAAAVLRSACGRRADSGYRSRVAELPRRWLQEREADRQPSRRRAVRVG